MLHGGAAGTPAHCCWLPGSCSVGTTRCVERRPRAYLLGKASSLLRLIRKSGVGRAAVETCPETAVALDPESRTRLENDAIVGGVGPFSRHDGVTGIIASAGRTLRDTQTAAHHTRAIWDYYCQ